ncbi:hypothetical protein PMZ80_007091 [Knufia obscura]|uniref:Uncharacterized protein n=2 Tax=Knufia TaxID=430999 RepID=A0AAN8EPD0_9EURO|nr:hypothetical protein PMZ80_007091 [Knufia obscura]KAK5953100.1 hypothetical protein OHC33_005668 [Knufia fluminis]
MWSDLPLELRLQVLKYHFRGLRIRFGRKRSKSLTNDVFALLAVSKSFVSREEVLISMFENAQVILYATRHIGPMRASLTGYQSRTLRSLCLPLDIRPSSSCLRLSLADLKTRFPRLQSLHFIRAGDPRTFHGLHSRFHVTHQSELFALVNGNDTCPGDTNPIPSLGQDQLKYDIAADLEDNSVPKEIAQSMVAYSLGCKPRADDRCPPRPDPWKVQILAAAALEGIEVTLLMNFWVSSFEPKRWGTTWLIRDATFSTRDMCVRFRLRGVDVAVPQVFEGDMAVDETAVKQWRDYEAAEWRREFMADNM